MTNLGTHNRNFSSSNGDNKGDSTDKSKSDTKKSGRFKPPKNERKRPNIAMHLAIGAGIFCFASYSVFAPGGNPEYQQDQQAALKQ